MGAAGPPDRRCRDRVAPGVSGAPNNADAMPGTTYGVRRTTIYLPDDLKRRLEQAARQDRCTEASIVREALEEALRRRDVAPTVPLFSKGWGDPTLAERVDEVLAETDF